ncbi:meso-2,3-butanediol dehydrogenase-like isoform X1 [Dermacentor albipictus]|uniref:meso-2,3-butanediol dehydrogenase-like isoform X1 n=1 Tax=Dermacentor albipictus TaxID=60249 RepID=UPI0031FBC8DC
MENLERVAEDCCAQGLPRDKVLVVPGDVTVEKDIAEVVQKTAKHFGQIDILVNNAGIPMLGCIQSASMEDFNRVWRTNFLGPLCMIKNAVPYLRLTKGSIVNVSSVAGLTAILKNVPYAVAKAALDHLTRCAALENAPYGVRVNSINPAYIKTTMGKAPTVSVEEHMEMMEKNASALHALARVAAPEEVAHCIAFLASDDAAFVTGTTMPFDGGMLLLSTVSDSPRVFDDKKST